MFGRSRVFKDVDTIPDGEDFRRALADAVARCDVLLAVIGPDWLELRNDRGQRRLDDELDFVKIEILSALRRDIRVIPLLLDDVPMPSPESLPESIRDLAFRHARRVRRDPDFNTDMDRLIQAIKQKPKRPADDEVNENTSEGLQWAGVGRSLSALMAFVTGIQLQLRAGPARVRGDFKALRSNPKRARLTPLVATLTTLGTLQFGWEFRRAMEESKINEAKSCYCRVIS